MDEETEASAQESSLWRDLLRAEDAMASAPLGSRDHELAAALVTRLRANVVERRRISAASRQAFIAGRLARRSASK